MKTNFQRIFTYLQLTAVIYLNYDITVHIDLMASDTKT